MTLLLEVLRLVVSRVQVVSAMSVLLLLSAASVLVAMRRASAWTTRSSLQSELPWGTIPNFYLVLWLVLWRTTLSVGFTYIMSSVSTWSSQASSACCPVPTRTSVSRDACLLTNKSSSHLTTFFSNKHTIVKPPAMF